jgi:hypothetical protein
VRLQTLESLSSISRSKAINPSRIVSLALRSLSDERPKLRASALLIISQLHSQNPSYSSATTVTTTTKTSSYQSLTLSTSLSPISSSPTTTSSSSTTQDFFATDTISQESSVDPQSILLSFFTDSDFRVRAAALRGMQILHERGYKLDLLVYKHSALALNDDFEEGK